MRREVSITAPRGDKLRILRLVAHSAQTSGWRTHVAGDAIILVQDFDSPSSATASLRALDDLLTQITSITTVVLTAPPRSAENLRRATETTNASATDLWVTCRRRCDDAQRLASASKARIDLARRHCAESRAAIVQARRRAV